MNPSATAEIFFMTTVNKEMPAYTVVLQQADVKRQLDIYEL